MCFSPQPAQDNSAALARQQEQERQDRIAQGRQKIDEAFSVFTPDYFNQFQSDYLGNYNPQVDEQFGRARQQLRYNLTRAGTVNSTPGQEAFGRLTEGYDDQRRAVASNALEATNKIRAQVEQNKSDLYGQNTASADPSLSAISAVGRAGSLQTPPSFSPIGDLFSGLVGGTTAYMQGRNQALPGQYRTAFAPGATLPQGSGRVVN